MPIKNRGLKILDIILFIVAVIAIAGGIVLATVSDEDSMDDTLDSQNNEFADGAADNNNDNKSDDDNSDGLVYTMKNGTYEVEYSGTCTETSISIPSSYMGVTVTSIASDAFNGCNTLVSVSLPSGITSIGERAFYGCESLEIITIPENVTSIGNYAFYNCVSLSDIKFNAVAVSDLSDNNYVFYNAGQGKYGITLNIDEDVIKIPAYLFCPTNNSSSAPKIIDVVFAESSKCTSIGTYAFAYCKNIASINIPDRMDSMGSYAFSECESLVNAIIPDRVTTVSAYLFYGCTSLKYLTIGEGVTTIESYAFSNCIVLEEIYFNSSTVSDLTSKNSVFENAGKNGGGITVTFAKNVTRVPAYLFDPYNSSSYAPKIKTVIFEDDSKCESIGDYAFYDCTYLASITIPDGVTAIESHTFQNCSALTELIIPDIVTSISSAAFSGCSFLEDITLPFAGGSAEATSASSETLFGYIFGTDNYDGGIATRQNYSDILSATYYIPSSLKSVTLTGGNILYGTFYGCTGITSITISDMVTTMGDYAFYNCTALEEIYFDASAMYSLSSGNCVFYNAGQSGPGITVTFGTNVGWIPSYLFDSNDDYSDAPKITKVIFEGDSQCAEIGSYAFAYCSFLTSVEIPASVAYIGMYAFMGCMALEEIYFNAVEMEDLSSSNYTFSNAGIDGSGITVTIGTSVTEIPAFLFCPGGSTCAPNIKAVIFEESAQCSAIGMSAFRNSIFLESINLPDNVKTIGDEVFAGCTSLVFISIGMGLTSMGDYAFQNCTALEEIIYNAEAMDDLSPYNCVFYNAGIDGSGINVTIGTGVTKIPACLFCPYNSSSYSPYIKTVIFDEECQCASIGYNAFRSCRYLTSITIPDSVTSIGDYAFYNCASLKSFIIPDATTSLGSFAFTFCSSMVSLSIGANVTSLGDQTFLDCYALEEIYFNSVAMNDLWYINVVFGWAGIKGSGITLTVGSSVAGIPANLLNSSGGWSSEYGDSYVKLTTVIFEKNSQCISIGTGAFDNCPNFTTVYYYGSEEDWNSISFGDSNEGLLSATIYFYSDSALRYRSESLYYEYGTIFNRKKWY